MNAFDAGYIAGKKRLKDGKLPKNPHPEWTVQGINWNAGFLCAITPSKSDKRKKVMR